MRFPRALSCAVASVLMAVAVTAAAQQTAAEEAGPSPLGVRQQRVARMMLELERRLLTLATSLKEAEPERAARLAQAFEESKALQVEDRMRRIVSLLDGARLDNARQDQQEVITDIRKLIEILLGEGADAEKRKEEIERLKEWHKQIAQLLRDEQQQQAESRKLDKKDEVLDQLQKHIAAVEELIRREAELIQQTAVARTEASAALDPLADRQQTIRNDTEFVAREMAASPGEAAGGQASEPSNSASASSQPQPGQQPLEQSGRHQKSAEQNLAQGRGKSAQEEEERALAELRKSLDELLKERDRLQNPPEDAFDKLAERQEATASKTDALGTQVGKAGQPGQPGSGTCSACQKCLSGACQSMQSASSELKKKSPGPASAEQKKAADELQNAMKELEKRLAELGEPIEDETIVRLEQIFGEMLTRQQQATAETVRFDADQKARREPELRRADRITLRRLSQEEQSLAGMAQQALVLIEEDGTSVSFPVVVADMRENLKQTAVLLEGHDTGEQTQTLQREIEKTLEKLIEALQVARKSGGGKAGKGGGNCKPCLLPNTAELKLLRALQLRVNRRTRAFDQARHANAIDEPRQAEIVRISDVQKEIAGMVRAIIDRTNAVPVLPGLPSNQ